MVKSVELIAIIVGVRRRMYEKHQTPSRRSVWRDDMRVVDYVLVSLYYVYALFYNIVIQLSKTGGCMPRYSNFGLLINFFWVK